MTIQTNAPQHPPVKRSIYLILWLLFGVLGVHCFYAGRTGRGTIELFTCGGLFILWFLDLFEKNDAYGRPMI